MRESSAADLTGIAAPHDATPTSQRPGKAEFVSVLVANVEIALAPCIVACIVARRENRGQFGSLGARMRRIDIV